MFVSFPCRFVDWLYLDEDFRITRGSKGSLFVHTREPKEAAADSS